MPKAERVDLDRLYMNEMAANTVLNATEEVAVGKAIVAAEAALLTAIARSPAGARALESLAEALSRGDVDIKHVLLNPDEEGLGLDDLKARLRTELGSLSTKSAAARAHAANLLAEIRLDGEVVEELAVSLVDDATDEGRRSRVAAARARLDLRRNKERLVVGNLRLVLLFARKFQGRGVPLLDLIQEGNLGLLRAVDKFDHRRGFRFSTYASWWIKQALQRSLLDRSLRVPVHVADDRRRVGRMRAVFTTKNGREPTPEEIASATGLEASRVQRILAIVSQPTSLDAIAGGEGDATVGDFVATTSAGPDEEVADHALHAHLEELLHGLNPREREVLRMRFGLGYPREHTLEEVGQSLALTRERIRQIERAALEKLKTYSRRIDLESYLAT